MFHEAENVDLSKMTIDEIREYRNKYNHFATLIGLSITDMKEGFGEVRMKITAEMRNPTGSVHGGCIATAADVAGGSAASSYGFPVATLDCSLHYLRPGLKDCEEIIGTGKVIKNGKRVIVTDVEVKSQTGTVLARGIYSFAPLT
ncbi:MAG: PaaI family thioesterase [Eubacterium sp.]|nr:PaaI family thioesterase [Eubacterium sp.]